MGLSLEKGGEGCGRFHGVTGKMIQLSKDVIST